MSKAEDNKFTIYVDIVGDGILQPLPKRGELSRKILEHISKRTMHRIEKQMTCKHLCADDKCEDGKLCHPERCKKWEYNTNLGKV